MRKSKELLYKVSAVLILLSAVLYIEVPTVASWIMIVSVVVFSIITMKSPYSGQSIRGKRLFGMQIISCFIMLAASYLMYLGDNLWALAMLIATVILFYTSIFIPKELEKEKANV